MKRGRQAVALAVALVVAVLVVSVPLGASAFPDYLGSRALGMGGAGRADARGDEGPLLNPAGMSLGRLYTVEGGYQFITRDQGHVAHASAVDSTSGFNLAGGLFYSYRTAAPPGAPGLSGHEAGLALSYPLGARVLVGVTAKYLYVSGGAAGPNGATKVSGITADAGVVIRAASMLTLGVVGYNLNDLSTGQAPVALGYGLALGPVSDFVVVVDALHDFTTSDSTRGVRTTIGGGGEYMFQHRGVVRAGGGHDGGSGHAYLTAGLAAISELGAVDFGFRQDITGDGKLTFLAVGLRLFVPQQ
jgi:hypothetical protein